MSATFPADTVPDGAVLAPHHAYIGLMLALLALAIVWDDAAGEEPLVGAVAVLAATFAFLSIWPFYPVTGAALSLAAVGLALVAPWIQFWSGYAWIGPRGLLLVGALVALDDVAEHAFGIWTPLDWFWKAHLFQHIK
jgi:hypothetical protein